QITALFNEIQCYFRLSLFIKCSYYEDCIFSAVLLLYWKIVSTTATDFIVCNILQWNLTVTHNVLSTILSLSHHA
ncbi:hypothetical protein L9F63_019076, partial [Diploptera punctata]